MCALNASSNLFIFLRLRMTDSVAVGTLHVKTYVIYLHVCIFVYQTEMLLCNLMLIALLEWGL